MKRQKLKAPPSKWYEVILENSALANKNPELSPYLDAEKFSESQMHVAAKLVSQSLPLTPLKELANITTKKLGLLMGQQEANFQALSFPETLLELQEAKSLLNPLRKKDIFQGGGGSSLHTLRITEAAMVQLKTQAPIFKATLQKTYQAATSQPDHQEAIDFFRGFSKGLSRPGIKDGKLVGRTKATDLQLKFFLHTEQVAECRNVSELRALLLKNGFTKETLGDDELLQKFCRRIGYAPGRRGRPPKN